MGYVFFFWWSVQDLFMSGSLILCIMMYVLFVVLCVHSFYVWFVCMREAWLVCLLFVNECQSPWFVQPFVCAKGRLWVCFAICFVCFVANYGSFLCVFCVVLGSIRRLSSLGLFKLLCLFLFCLLIHIFV